MPPEVLEQFYLAQSTFRQDLLAEDICNLLDRNALAGLGIRSRAILKVSSHSECNSRGAYQTMP